MAYCTIEQITDRYGARFLIELSDRGEEAATEADAALFNRAIADADALIDGYLKGRYQLPLAAVPPLLADLSQRIAIYFAHANVASDKIRKDYEDALKVLDRIGSGMVKLDAGGVEPEGADGSGVRTNDRERPLTEETMRGYI